MSYWAENRDGRVGFLKALDYSLVIDALPDHVDRLSYAVERYKYERDLMELSRNHRMRRVVRALDSGNVVVQGSELPVPYLIFERGDNDLRQVMATVREVDDAWRLRLLHQISVGLFELHNAAIAHQDLKPSNVVQFGTDGVKLADLGRSICRAMVCPYENESRAGDRAYAPPEALYHYIPSEWFQRRFGCDLYLLGSMAVFLFSGMAMTTLLVSELADPHRPAIWGGGFAAVLPHLQDAFGRVLPRFKASVTGPIAPRLTQAVIELCEPDPARRGRYSPFRRNRSQYSVEPYVSLFDRLAYIVETSVTA